MIKQWLFVGLSLLVLISTVSAAANLFSDPESINTSAWTRYYLWRFLNDTTLAPDGNTTADTYNASAGTDNHYLYQATSFTSGLPYTLSGHFKKYGTNDKIQLTFSLSRFGSVQYADFNITSCTVTESAAVTTQTASAANGFCRVAITATATSTGAGNGFYIFTGGNSGRAPSYNGTVNPSEAVAAWGMMLEQSSSMSVYGTPIGTVLTTPQFGALSNPTGNPIGGGEGYSQIITEGDYTVSTAAELQLALTDCAGTLTPKIIYILDSADIDLTGIYGISVPGNVTIASNRGYLGSVGGRIFRTRLPSDPGLDDSYRNESTFWIAGNNIRFTGLRIEGDNMTSLALDDSGQTDFRYGITICPEDWRNITVDNNEMFGWSASAVFSNTYHNIAPTVGLATTEIGSTILNVHHNYFHHNQGGGIGYSVAIYRNSSALVKGNLFDYTRHAIASDGYANTGYEASYNIHLGHSTDHIFDAHKDQFGGAYAGTLFRVHHNTVYVGTPTDTLQPWSVGIRSVPQTSFSVFNNDFPYATWWGVAQQNNHDSSIIQYDGDGTGNVSAGSNLMNGTYNQTGWLKICHQESEYDYSCGYS